MASHLLLADWIDERFRPEPVLIDQGYPLGPARAGRRARRRSWARARSTSSPGSSLAIPALTALVAYAALDGLRHAGRGWAPRRSSRSRTWPPPTSRRRRSRSRSWRCSSSPSRSCCRAPRTGATRSRSGPARRGGRSTSTPSRAWPGSPGSPIVWGLWRIATARAAGSPARRCSPRPSAPLCSLIVLVAARARPPPRLRRLPRPASRPGQRGRPRQPAGPALAARGARDLADQRVPALGRRLEPAGRRLLRRRGLRARLRSRSRCRAGSAATAPRSRPRSAPRSSSTCSPAALGTVYTSAKALAIAAPLISLIILGGLLGSARRPLVLLGSAFAVIAALCSLPDPAPGAGRARQTTPTSWRRSGRWSRARSCSSSAATTSSSTSCAARSRSPTCATSTTPTSSSPTSSSRDVGLEVRLRLGDRGDAGPVPIRAHDPRRVRERPAAGLPRGRRPPTPTCSGRSSDRRSGESRRRPAPSPAARTAARPRPSRGASRRSRPSRCSASAVVADHGRERRVGNRRSRTCRRGGGSSRSSTTRPAR